MKIVAVSCDSVAETARFEACLAAVSASARAHVLSARSGDDRRRRLCAVAALDACLQTVGLRESAVSIARGEHGKPFLPEHPTVQFSIAHSGSWAVCALDSRAVGVDLEQVRDVRYAALAKRHFTPEETDWLAAQEDGLLAFFRLWTAKESVLKARGVGLAGGLTVPVLDGGRLSPRFKEYALPGYVLTAYGEGAFPEALTVISSCDSVLLR